MVEDEKYAGIKKKLFLRSLRSGYLDSLCTILKPTCEYLERDYNALSKKLFYVPDPVKVPEKMSRHEALNLLGLSDSRCIIVIYGSIAPRKGVFELLEGIKNSSWPTAATILCAGPQRSDVEKIIEKEFGSELRSGKLQIINRFLRGLDESAVYSIADLMWVGYRNFSGNSAVLLQSVASGIPVIGNNQGMVGVFLRQNKKSGYLIDTADPTAIARVVQSFIKEPKRVPDKLIASILDEAKEELFKSGVVNTFNI